jgi:hypothetical protein
MWYPHDHANCRGLGRSISLIVTKRILKSEEVLIYSQGQTTKIPLSSRLS